MLAEFDHRVQADLLQTYCRARGYSSTGFRPQSISVEPEDARDCLRALDGGLFEHLGNGRYRLPKSSATEVLFWEGRRTETPRPIFLWAEPVITFAAIARLHYDYGWPTQLLGTQPPKWAFDLSACLPDQPASPYLLGEIKKSRPEAGVLLENMLRFCEEPPGTEPSRKNPRRNAYKKWLSLTQEKNVLFWLVGPGRSEQLFEVARRPNERISLHEVPIARLKYPK